MKKLPSYFRGRHLDPWLAVGCITLWLAGPSPGAETEDSGHSPWFYEAQEMAKAALKRRVTPVPEFHFHEIKVLSLGGGDAAQSRRNATSHPGEKFLSPSFE